MAKNTIEMEVKVELDMKGSAQQMIGAMETGAVILHEALHRKFYGLSDEETEETITIDDAYAGMMDSIVTFKVYIDKL